MPNRIALDTCGIPPSWHARSRPGICKKSPRLARVLHRSAIGGALLLKKLKLAKSCLMSGDGARQRVRNVLTMGSLFLLALPSAACDAPESYGEGAGPTEPSPSGSGSLLTRRPT